MEENFETILTGECGLVKDRHIIVGVSGGPDSLCLMEVLRQAGYPIIVAYFDHQLRPDSGADARMVEKTAARLMLACVIGGADVRDYAEKNKLSVEEAARNLRYRFMFDLARRRNAQAVAVGHTADDQVETVLMHFIRGSGIAGLKGMSYRSIIKTFDPEIPIVRPLLHLWREETVVYCAVHGLRPLYDSTNDSLNFQRNRIRHLLIPTLETYNPKFREALLRMSQSLKSDYAFVMESLEQAWKETVLAVEDDIVTFDLERLSAYSPGFQRNLIRHAMQTLRPNVEVTFNTLERARHLLASAAHLSRVDLKAGLQIFREERLVYICTTDAELPFDLWPQMPGNEPLPLLTPGQVPLAGGWRVVCERWRLPALAVEQAERNEDPFQVWLDAGELPESLELRARRQGDSFEPLGMDGHSQKISDFFVNEKVPQRARDRWPLLCAGDEIVWIPGYRPAHRHRLKDDTRSVVYFSVIRPSDSAPTETIV
ncbi:MAG: tRNA lysidine(34) synthetase TilS [Chloroflexi bacterium]|nr:tRNA lysidine(34) synthetase TilS [Chloroflexota bacterium]